MTNRTYKYFEGTPLFPFGHGLSYSNFEYSDLKYDQQNVQVTIKNSGARAGLETIQVYLATPDMADTPQRALIAFQKEYFEAGETRTLKINLPSERLKIVAADGQKIDPEGRVLLTVGGKQPGFSGVADSPSTQTITQQIMMK